MAKKIIFPIKKFETLPSDLNKSNYIDFLLLLANLKPALRIKIDRNLTKHELNTWCTENHFGFSSNEGGYICVAVDKDTADLVQKTDDSYEPHEYKLGLLLGYPTCCCKNISTIGEKFIDEWEGELIKNYTFEGEFELINPKGYGAGFSLISHVPCSPVCKPSLNIAQKSLQIITFYKFNKHFSHWKYWTKK
ncbi:hypothetical protein [Desulforegula conservatrix]|uniref:hypothetical protein n=1 Tax=Desulforegula conservatrix TaxID=153026 RepID=UPI0003FD9370|nr:hypothetical protein [Desulforegula conservatrix]